MHTLPRPSSSLPSAAPAPTVGVISVDVATLEVLRHHAASAARMVGHLDDAAGFALIGQISDHVDLIAHEPAELLDDPQRRTACSSSAPSNAVRDGEPTLMSIAGGGH